MELSRTKTSAVADYLRLDEDDPVRLKPIMEAALKYIMDFTGMSEAELDEHEDLYVAFMVLCQDMYDNRALYTDKASVNKVVDSILARHRTNFV